MNNSEPSASIMDQIGPQTIGNAIVTTWGVMSMFILPCLLPIPPSDIDWLNSPQKNIQNYQNYQINLRRSLYFFG